MTQNERTLIRLRHRFLLRAMLFGRWHYIVWHHSHWGPYVNIAIDRYASEHARANARRGVYRVELAASEYHRN